MAFIVWILFGLTPPCLRLLEAQSADGSDSYILPCHGLDTGKLTFQKLCHLQGWGRGRAESCRWSVGKTSGCCSKEENPFRGVWVVQGQGVCSLQKEN